MEKNNCMTSLITPIHIKRKLKENERKRKKETKKVERWKGKKIALK